MMTTRTFPLWRIHDDSSMAMTRPGLTDLPQELFLEIYQNLDSIDDVHHLARTCKRAYFAISKQTTYIQVMRSVIGRSSQHRYDVQLCKILALHGDIVRHFQNGGSPPTPTQKSPSPSSPAVLNIWEETLLTAAVPSSYESVQKIPNQWVEDILARYQGMRLLQDLWLERQLTVDDFMEVYNTGEADELASDYEELKQVYERFRDGATPARCLKTPESHTWISFNTDQRARLYAAVTCIWLLNEIKWVLAQFKYPSSFNIQVSMLYDMKKNIESQTQTPLLDEIDQMATLQFLYHHLLPLHGSLLADRDSANLPMTFPCNVGDSSVHNSRLFQLFLTASQTYLQPPDILDLVVRSRASRKIPYPKTDFPPSHEQWIRPCRLLAFPAGLDLSQHTYGRALEAPCLDHINMMRRVALHHGRNDHPRQIVWAPVEDQLFDVFDHFGWYLMVRACTIFEADALGNWDQRYGDLRRFSKVIDEEWPAIRWQVWWWANSEEKARMKIERLRQGRFDTNWEIFKTG